MLAPLPMRAAERERMMIRGVGSCVGLMCLLIGGIRMATASNPPPGLSECGGYGVQNNVGQPGGPDIWVDNDPPIVCIAPCPSPPPGHVGSGTCELRSRTGPQQNGQPGTTITVCACVFEEEGGGETVMVALTVGWGDLATAGDIACQPAIQDSVLGCFASDSACGAMEDCEEEYHWGFVEGSSSRGFRCACR